MSSHIVIPTRRVRKRCMVKKEKRVPLIPLKVPKKKGSFKPRIKKKRKDLMKENIEKMSKSTKRKISPEEFVDRTVARFRGNDEKRKKKIAQLKFQIIEETSKELSFKPRINKHRSKSRSRTPLMDRVNNILNNKNKKLNSLRKKLSSQKGDNELKECTFQPECMTSPKRKKSKKEVMRGVERLLDWKRERDVKLMKAKIKKKQESVCVSVSSSRKFSKGNNLGMVSERLYRKYEVKKKKLEQRKREQTEGLFHPKINKRSMELAKGIIRGGRLTPRISRTPTKRQKKGEMEFKVTPMRRRDMKKFRKLRKGRSKTREKQVVRRISKETRKTRREVLEEEDSCSEEEDEMIEIPTTFHSERDGRSSVQSRDDFYSSLVFAEKERKNGRSSRLNKSVVKGKDGVINFLKDLCVDVEETVNRIR